MRRHHSGQPRLWPAFGYGVLGITLCSAGGYIGILFLLLGCILLWYYYHPAKPTIYPAQALSPRETPADRSPRIQVPTKYVTPVGDCRCYLCKSGITCNQPAWLHNDES